MSAEPAPDQLPVAAWAVGWSFLVGQVLQLAELGINEGTVWPISMLLGVALAVFFSHGVLRARLVRCVIVFVLMALALLVQLAAVVDSPGGWALVRCLLTGVQLGCLVWFARTPWFAWQRTRPEGGPSLQQLLLVAAAVGALGGLTPPATSGLHFELNV